LHSHDFIPANAVVSLLGPGAKSWVRIGSTDMVRMCVFVCEINRRGRQTQRKKQEVEADSTFSKHCTVCWHPVNYPWVVI